MSAATSRIGACGGRRFLLTAAVLAGLAVLFGGAGGAGATSLAACSTSVSTPTATPPTGTAGTYITYNVTVTASAGCANGSPTGTVSFFSNYVVNGQPTRIRLGFPVPVQASGTNTGTAALVDNSLPAGSFTITASYSSSNTALFTASGSFGTPVVIQSNSVIVPKMDFTLSPSTVHVGQNVTFTVHITPVDANGNPTGGVATGMVHFSAGPAGGSGQFAFADVQLDNTGSLTFQYNGFVEGDYIVIASYGGDPVDQSVSGQLPLTVLPAVTPVATTTTVSASPSSISTGSTTTLQAHVVESASQTPPPAGGTVNFYAGPTSSSVQFEGSGQLDANGNAQLTGVGNFTAGTWVIRASYVGDAASNVGGSSDDNTLAVSAPVTLTTKMPTRTSYVGDVHATYGAQATLSARLAQLGGTPISGEPLTLTMGSQSCVTPPTTGTGIASCTITVAQTPGQYPITATFNGDGSWTGSSDANTFTVDRTPSSLAYTGDTVGVFGANAVLSATLTGGIAGDVVHLTMGSQSCDGPVDGSGHVSCTITIAQAPAPYPVTATFAGDTYAAGSSATGTFTVAAAPTTTTYTGATHGVRGTAATLSAHVATVPDGSTVTFAVGSQTCAGVTTNGDASCTVVLTDAVGTGYTVTAAYAGDLSHLGSSASKPFTIFSPTTATHAGQVAPVLAGTAATLTATVTPSAATGTVTFATGGTTVCTATLSNGAASCAATLGQPGSYAVTATYNGDGVFPRSSDTTTVLVYAFAPGGGAFVVGDKTATGSVTFWGDKWAKLNSLSGGGAPAAFKGYALTAPTACSGTWSTDPGNSTPPPIAPLPTYMAVIVTSRATKSGSQISGNVVAIVIVKTDAGYKGDPGHAGTGTVVATVCGG